MPRYQLAHLNIAWPKGPMESPVMADFVAQLDEINALAEGSSGYVWRLKDDAGNATAIRPLGDSVLVNMSVWESPEALRDFVYRSAHSAVMRRRREWFERPVETYLVMWWVPAGHQPTVEEAIARLTQLREKGPSAEAFTFAQIFPAPDVQPDSCATDLSETCPAL
jgi:Domain of unknown function (DUF3291)